MGPRAAGELVLEGRVPRAAGEPSRVIAAAGTQSTQRARYARLIWKSASFWFSIKSYKSF